METDTTTNERRRIADDFLFGGPAIAQFLGITEARVYHYVRQKKLPVGHLGKTLVASRSKLQRAFDRLITTKD